MLIPLILCCLLNAGQNPAAIATIATVRDNQISFPNGQTFETPLYQLKLLGHLPRSNKLPYLVLSGSGCTDCCALRTIYIHSFSDGPVKEESDFLQFPFPGKEREIASDQVIFESRAFYGNVLPDVPNGIISYQKSRLENGSMETSVVLAQVLDGKITQKRITTSLPDIKLLIKLATAHKCKKIKPINYTSLP